MNMSTLCTSLHRACIIALTTIVANPTAQAADTTRTLACQGEVKISTDNGGWQQPVSQGIIVNFAQQLRKDPSRSIGRGLARYEPAPGSIVVFAAKEG